MTQYYDSLDDFTEREKELLAEQSTNVADNATSTGVSIASTIQNLQALDTQWSTTLNLTEPLTQYKTQLDELYEAEQKNYKDRLAAAEQFVKEYNATMAKMTSTASGGIQISGGASSGGGGSKKTGSTTGATIGAAIGGIGGTIGSVIGGTIGGIIGSITSKKGSTSKKTSSSTKKKKYASGGVNDYTGDAALHGTPNHVETVFNAEDGKKLYDLVHNTKDLADTIAEDMIPYIPSLFENIGDIGFNPRNMMMPTVSKVEPQTVENDESTTFSNCKFEIKTDANNFEALVNDMEIKIKNR